jgi:dimethylaniline monooxygenase (N-oxide forming)
MKIIIIGAGFAGLSSAKVLKSFGHEVTVFEKEEDVGGVWSASRRYPGLITQNVRSTYALSDFPYPPHYPEWPSGEQVQAYLASYARQFELGPLLHLGTEVTGAQPDPDGWTVSTRQRATGAVQTHHCEYLLVCNGIFSEPLIPDYPGAEEFREAGGRICHTSQLHTQAEVKDKHLLVVGYGKSACDLAQANCAQAASTRVVARALIWKMPKRILNVLNYKFLLLTRLGEGLFKYIRVTGAERFLHGAGRPVRNALMKQLQWVVTRQCKLRELDLVPPAPFETIARSTVSLVTDGFFESVAAGRIKVEKGSEIRRLLSRGGPYAELSSGELVRADVIVCGTGWQQRVPFLPPEVSARLTDDQGNFRLHRFMTPVHVPRLAFNGYNSSLFSQLNCEIGALWLADLLGGGLRLPSAAQQDQGITARLAWMEARTEGKHARGTNLIPFSLHHIDELLADMRLPLGAATRLKQWLLPTAPGDYAPVSTRLLARYNQA